MAASGNGYKAEDVIKAIEGTGGFVTDIAKNLGCARTYVYTLLDKYPTAQKAWEDEKEGQKDTAEKKLHDLIEDGNITAIIFYLKTQAKNRGYVERHELTGADGKPIVVNWDDGSNDN